MSLNAKEKVALIHFEAASLFRGEYSVVRGDLFAQAHFSTGKSPLGSLLHTFCGQQCVQAIVQLLKSLIL